ncbi:hypothetical protein ACWEPN_30035 [Nonomuraea wenchangensis]
MRVTVSHCALEAKPGGVFGTIAARSVRGDQAAAAAVVVVEELTGSTVTGWDPDESSRSINGTSSCYPVHQVDRPAVVLPEPRRGRRSGRQMCSQRV